MLYPSFEFGGVVRHLSILSEGLMREGIRVSLLTDINKNICQKPLYFNQIVNAKLIPSTLWNLFKGVGLLLYLHFTLRYTIIHSHHRFTTLMGKIASNLLGVPLVSTVHEFKNDRRFLVRYSLPEYIISPTRALALHLEEHFGLPKSRIVVIPHGLPDLNVPHPNSFQGLPWAPADRCIIGFIGRLSIEKVCEDFIHTAALVLEEEPSVMFYVIGDGPQRHELEGVTKKLSINNRVIFLGYREDIETLMSHINILVMPSHTENFPYTLLEAMRAKIPVVATKVGGIPEILEGYPSDLLVEPRQIDDLARGILKLIRDPYLSTQLAEQNYSNFREYYSSERMVRGTLEIYDRLSRREI